MLLRKFTIEILLLCVMFGFTFLHFQIVIHAISWSVTSKPQVSREPSNIACLQAHICLIFTFLFQLFVFEIVIDSFSRRPVKLLTPLNYPNPCVEFDVTVNMINANWLCTYHSILKIYERLECMQHNA